MKYDVYGVVTGTKFIGTFEAESEDEAKEKAWKSASVSLCHQCSRECEGAEIEELNVEKA